MNLIAWILFGLVSGALANAIYPSNSKGGTLSAIVLGIAGAFIGGVLASLFLGIGVTGFNFPSLIVAIFGSLVLLYLARYLNRTSNHERG